MTDNLKRLKVNRSLNKRMIIVSTIIVLTACCTGETGEIRYNFI